MTTTTTSHKIADNLFLVRQVLPRSGPPPKPAVPPPTNHIAIVDCSGSMYGELDKVKAQLKNKLATLLGPKDTMTLIWFSGRGQCGLIIEAEPVASLPDLAAVHKAIDKWLHPVGLTGFKEPIELAIKTAQKLAGKGACSLFFMSDGCDNQWSRPEILKVVSEVSKVCSASAFVEYGYYADRALLAAMAEKAGGAHVHCEDFQHYEPTFAAVLGKQVVGAKRIEVDIAGDPILGFAYAAHDGDLLTFGVEFNKIAVPEAITEVFYLSPQPVGTFGADLAALCTVWAPRMHTLTTSDTGAFSAAYMALSLFAVRMKPDIIYPILRALGDVHFIERFSACFGKQQYSAFMNDAREAVWTPRYRFAKGYDPSKVPNDDATTVLQVLQILVEDGASVIMDHPEWKYLRIGRERVDADDLLPPDLQAKVDELTAKLGATKVVSKRKDIQAEIDKIILSAPAALKFTADPAPEGYPLMDLVLNNERPNVSIRVKKEGTIDLTARIAATTGIKNLDKLPAPFPSFIYRAYTIIKDGLVNVERMPVKLSRAAFDKLRAAGVELEVDPDRSMVAVINLKPLPTINRSMVKTASARKLFELEWQLVQSRAKQKVYNAFATELAPKISKGYGVVYGPEAAEWLKEQGITDYSGFSPKAVQVPASGDFYMAKLLSVSLKGFASLPSVKDVRAKMGNGKGKAPTGCTALMIPTVEEVDAYLATNAKAPQNVRAGYVEGIQKATVAQTRGLLFAKAQAVFTIVVGQVWFEEFPTLDDKTLTLKLTAPGLDGPQDVACTVELEEEQINL